MKIWALADLHLSYQADGLLQKPMDIFGQNWQNHDLKIKEAWLEKVAPEDLVLIAGDFSWAMNLEDLVYDLKYLEDLPGHKLLLRGNHDYWWTSAKKMRDFFPENISFLQNNHYKVNEKLYICGSRGWTVPGDKYFNQEDEKIYAREILRLKISLESVPKVKEREIMVMLHYPPVNINHDHSELIALLEEYEVKTCIFGHLHDYSADLRLPNQAWGINFHLTSADFLNFTPLLIKEIS